MPRIRDPYFPATSRHLRTGVPDSSRQRQMGHGLAIGRSLQAVPRTTGMRWVGQPRREIRAPSPPPFLPFQRFNGHTPGRCCALRNETSIGGNFAIRFSDRDERILVRNFSMLVRFIFLKIIYHLLFESLDRIRLQKFFVLENLISFDYLKFNLGEYKENDVDTYNARNKIVSRYYLGIGSIVVCRLNSKIIFRGIFILKSNNIRRYKKMMWIEYEKFEFEFIVHLHPMRSIRSKNSKITLIRILL